MIHPVDRNARPTSDFRFIKESRGGLTIQNVMLEDNGKWQCEAENAHGYVENARPVKLVVLGESLSVIPSLRLSPIRPRVGGVKLRFEPGFCASDPRRINWATITRWTNRNGVMGLCARIMRAA